MVVELPDHMVGAMGETVFSALIKLQPNGRLLLLVPTSPVGLIDDECWLTAEVDCPAARRFGAELEVHGQGGGRA